MNDGEERKCPHGVPFSVHMTECSPCWLVVQKVRAHLEGSNESADRVLSIPALDASADTIVTTGMSQTISGTKSWTDIRTFTGSSINEG